MVSCDTIIPLWDTCDAVTVILHRTYHGSILFRKREVHMMWMSETEVAVKLAALRCDESERLLLITGLKLDVDAHVD